MLARWIAQSGLASHLPPIAIRLLGLANQLSRYTVVSALALLLDFAVYLSLEDAGMRAAAAGVAGYVAGMVLHFSLSTRYVFKKQARGKTEARRFAEFLMSGLVGIVLTAAVIELATAHLDLAPLYAKLAAVVLSFLTVFLLRRSVVFAGPR